MPDKSPKVDAYIEKAPPFARPILVKLRSLFHKACPKIEEKMKWNCPSFEYKGMVGGFAAFKKHVSWGLWKSKLLKDPDGVLLTRAASPMGAGKITSTDELPADEQIVALIKQAVALNEAGVTLPNRGKTKRPPPRTPADLAAALKRNAKAATTFTAFAPSHKREYIEWLTEAKSTETRQRRLAQAIEWMAQGKSRNWKYERS